MISWFKNLKIRTKLVLSFGIIVLIGALVSAYNIISLMDISQKSLESNRIMLEAKAVENARLNLLRQELAGRTLILTSDSRYLDQYNAYSKEVDAALTEALQLAHGSTVVQQLQLVVQQKKDYDNAWQTAQMGRMDLFDKMQPMHNFLWSLAEASRDDMRKANEEAVKSAQTGSMIALVTMILSILIGAVAAAYLAGLITKPILQFRDVAEKVSMGDLDTTVKIDSKDEIGDMTAAFNRMVIAVRFLIAEAGSGGGN